MVSLTYCHSVLDCVSSVALMARGWEVEREEEGRWREEGGGGRWEGGGERWEGRGEEVGE